MWCAAGLHRGSVQPLQSPGLNPAWSCSLLPWCMAVPLLAAMCCIWGFGGSGLHVYRFRLMMVSWKACAEIFAIYFQTRSDTFLVMPMTNILLPICFVTATPKGPRKPASGTGETSSQVSDLSTAGDLLLMGVVSTGCMCAAALAEALGHLCLPIES